MHAFIHRGTIEDLLMRRWVEIDVRELQQWAVGRDGFKCSNGGGKTSKKSNLRHMSIEMTCSGLTSNGRLFTLLVPLL